MTMKQLGLKDLDRLPDPAIDAAELSPQEVVGEETWDALDEAQQRQLTNELDEWLSGMYRARSYNQKALSRGDGHELPALAALKKAWLVPVEHAIREEREHVAARKRRGRLPAWFKCCKTIPASSLAQITLDEIISTATSTQPVRGGASLTFLAVKLGAALEWMLKLDAWLEANPALLRSYKKRLQVSGATKSHAQKVLLHGYNHKFIPSLEDADAAPDKWDGVTRAAVGTGLVLIAVAATGGRISLIDDPADLTTSGHAKRRSRKRSPNKPRKLVVLDEETTGWVKDALRHNELHDRRLRPMVCEPLPWRGPRGGGYLLGNGLTGRVVHDFNSSGRRVFAALREKPHRASPVYSALNYLGSTKYRVRRGVLEIALEARENNIALPDLPVEGRRVPIPVKPGDIETNEEARKLYRRSRARAEEENFRAKSRELSSEFALQEADLLKDEPALWFPHRCDFRGRIYPMAQGLQIQGSDLRRALLEFAEGKPITQDDSSAGWLAAYVAKVYGRGKLSYDDRVAWTFDNEGLIRRIAEDPLGHRQEWEGEADGKHLWQCLAASQEWIAYLDAGDGFVSRMPLYVDGTCNGIQHFAALSRDADLARLVNLSPSEEPQDIYLAIAERAFASVMRAAKQDQTSRGDLARMWVRLLDGKPSRKLAKKVVMIHPYGGALSSVMADVREQLRAMDPDHAIIPADLKPQAAGFMGKEMKDALLDQLARPEAVLAWLRRCVELVATQGPSPGVMWETPTGWQWALLYGVTESRRLDVKTLGQRARLSHVEESDRKVDVKKQKSAASPNFVHALDAAALVFAINLLREEGSVAGVAAIHDSVGALAADMPLVDSAVREGFVQLYSEHDPLRSFYEATLAQVPEASRHLVPEPPEPGDFDIREVLSSAYFFS